MNNKKHYSEIINNIDDSSNGELKSLLDYLNEEFEQTKMTIIKLTKHLDSTEILYNKVYKELEKRTK